MSIYINVIILCSILIIIILGTSFTLCACGSDRIVVYTNAFFAPFEYYDGTDIVGVDVEIMNLVGKKLNKKVTIKNVDFGVIIDEVASGKLCDCGAAGITVTQSRLEKVNFSIHYYTSVQYVIFEQGDFTTLTADDGTEYVLWSELAGKKIGTQLDTTGDIYVDIEINGDGDYVGELAGTGAESIQYDNAQLAVQALVNGKNVDAVVIDQMPYISLKIIPISVASPFTTITKRRLRKNTQLPSTKARINCSTQLTKF